MSEIQVDKARRLPPLHALRAFEAAARHLSFRRAAAELAVTPTAVSHHVRQLEDMLGVKLFQRGPRRVALTPEGGRLFPALRDGFDSFAQAIGALREGRLRRVVTLSATVAFTGRWLVPRVPAFRRANPHLDLRLHASDEPVDLQSGIADAAIRYGPGGYAGLRAELLFHDQFAPVCSPVLGVQRSTDLARQTLIHFEWRRPRRDSPTWQRWLKQAELQGGLPGTQLILTDESQAIAAAIAGQGVALVSLALVADELARGTLMQPFGPVLDGFRYDLVYPEAASDSERVAALRDWIRAEMTTAMRQPAHAALGI